VTGRALAALVWALVLATTAFAVDWNTNQFEIPSGSETYRFKQNPATGDIALEANQCALMVNGLVCEGATADAFEGRLSMPEASGADNLWSLPPGGGVLVAGPLTYSGVGACGANSWVSALTDHAAPTCTQPSFANLSGAATDAQIPNNITVDLATTAGTAATATALAADPTDCSTNQYANAIAASGNLACSQVNFNQLAGTATDAQIPDSITIANAAHAGIADTLTADPVDCPPGQYASVINEAGDLACAQVAFSELAGTLDGTSITTGTIPVNRLNATGQGSNKFVRSDGSWAFPLRTACVAIDNVTSSTLKPFWIAPDSSVTITALRCNYFDSCATPPTVQPQDQAATVIGPSSIACVAGTIGTWTTIASANILAARSVLYMKVTNTPTATCDMLVCVQYLG
jgi:hypothetical protein